MNKQLQRLIDLSNKTGDRLVVFNPRNEAQAYIIMGVDSYENLAVGRHEVRGLTEDELLDKINRDIAIWKSDKNTEKLSTNKAEEIVFKDDSYIDDKDDFFGKEEEDDYEEEDEWYSIDEIAEKKGYKIPGNNNIKIEGEDRPRRKGPWQIPSERKEKAEEIIEEDRVYLEDVED